MTCGKTVDPNGGECFDAVDRLWHKAPFLISD